MIKKNKKIKKYKQKFCHYCNKKLMLNTQWFFVNDKVYCCLEEASYAYSILYDNKTIDNYIVAKIKNIIKYYKIFLTSHIEFNKS